MRTRPPVRSALAVPYWLGLAFAACSPAGSDHPLGWGPVEVGKSRHWSKESLDGAPRWTVGNTPTFVMVPDSVESIWHGASGEVLVRRKAQRVASGAAFLPDGRVVLAYAPQQPDSILLHFLDPATGRSTAVAAPKGENGEGLRWSYGGMVVQGGDVVLAADNLPVQEEPRNGTDVWYADAVGAFARPPSRIPTDGRLAGAMEDGSLVIVRSPEALDTLFLSRVLAVRPTRAGTRPEPLRPARPLFVNALARDPQTGEGLSGGVHRPEFATAAAGTTIWTVPTERPELFAVDRSGDVRLKIEWDAGDRTIPPGAPGFWGRMERHSAAAKVAIGSDGLVYVQRWTLRESPPIIPVMGPEWLVFTPAGELAARFELPMEGWAVSAFGDGSLVAAGTNTETSLREVRIYAIRRPV